MKLFRYFFSLIFLIIAFQACENENAEPDESKISTFGSTESHNNGLDCISCHVQGGDGKGWFTLAGSIYDSTLTRPYANATIQLYTERQGGGAVAYTVEVDALGNFYTTEPIDFGAGLFPAAVGNLETKYMQTSISAAGCNECHANGIDPIWTK